MANKKMTKRDYFNTLLGIVEVKANPELVKFIDHELELLAKKNSTKDICKILLDKEEKL